MKKRNIIMFLMLGLLHASSAVYAVDIKAMLTSMGQSFGAPPVGYTYSYEVWSDASVPIYVEQEGIASFMGAYFQSAKGYFGKKMLPSIFGEGGSFTVTKNGNTGANVAGTLGTALAVVDAATAQNVIQPAEPTPIAVCHNQPYYFNMYIGTDASPHDHPIYQQVLTQLPLVQNDPDIYYYHVYTAGGYSKGNSTHKPAVESMGFQNPSQVNIPNSTTAGSVTFSSQLSSISFYNSSGTDVQVSLTYGTDPYTFTLEKYSYNTLDVPTPQAAQSATSSVSSSVTPAQPMAGVVTPATTTTPQPTSLAQAGAAAGNSTSNASSISSFAQAPAATQNVVTQAMTPQPTLSKSTGAAATTAPVAPAISSTATSASSADDSDTPPPFSLRPNTLTFASYDATSKKNVTFKTLILPENAFQTNAFVIEVFQDPGQSLNVGIQGFTPGNYDLAVTPRARDLTPCPCVFWYQSFVQGGSVQGYGDLPGQVWVAYGGTDSIVQTKVLPGQAVSWNLVRPLIGQGDQFVYFVYVVTTNDTVAKNFVTKVVAQQLGNNVIGQYQTMMNAPIATSTTQSLDVTGPANTSATTSLTSAEQVAAVMGNLSTVNGVIQDTDQGVIGYIVGTDVFSPSGLGYGNYYYTLAPSVMSFANVVSFISTYVNSPDQTALTTTVNGWFADYMKQPSKLQKEVQQYLIQNGNAQVVNGTALTQFGNTALQLIVSGPVSIQYPSMKLSTVANQYVYDFGKSAPDQMPTPVTIAQLQAMNNPGLQMT